MPLLDNTQLALESAMNGAMLRQSLLANDLANAATPGFKPEDVNFQQTLASAMASGQSPASVTYTPYVQNVTNAQNGNGVNPDVINSDIAENGLLYSELTQIATTRENILLTAMGSAPAVP
jgi:flagellar basal-body rod protein FlgB